MPRRKCWKNKLQLIKSPDLAKVEPGSCSDFFHFLGDILPGHLVLSCHSTTCSIPYLTVTGGPVVSRAAAVLGEVDVLRVVQLVVLRVHDVVDHARLQVQQHRPGDVVLVVGLMERRGIFPLVLKRFFKK